MKDTIYINGTIITVDDSNQEVDSVVVSRGRIIFAGKKAEAMKYKKSSTSIIDLEGKTMLPGFIDPHSHFIMAAMISGFAILSSPPLDTIKSIEDIIQRLKDTIKDKKIKPGNPVVGWGFDESLLKNKRVPTKADLDKVSKEHPVYIVHQSGHTGVASSLSLRIFNIDGETENPEGGRIGRISGSNEPNGILEETAHIEIVKKLMGKLKLTEIPRLLKSAAYLYASNGITTAQDGGMIKQTLGLAGLADKLGLFKQDIVGYYMVDKLEDFNRIAKSKRLGRYGKHFKLGGAKLLLDGSPQAKTAWLSKPYHIPPEGREPDYCGYPMHKDDNFVTAVYEESLKRNIQILTHTNGDQASEQYITCFENAKKKLGNRTDIRPVMIHAQTVRDDQLDRMKEINMIPSFFQFYTFFWGDWHINSVLGKERAYRISPVRSAIERNIPYTFHQDTPVLPPDMIFTLWTAVNRKTRTGEVIGPDQRVSIMEAIRAITINAAYQYFEEDSKGSITPGKRADLVILDKNPLKVNVDEIKNIKVLETIKDGRTIYSTQ